MIYWLTGQPGAGKTTLARALRAVLDERGHHTILVDAEHWRRMGGNQDYSEAGRRKNIASAQQFAEEKSGEGSTVICSFVSPYRDMREALKKRAKVIEIYVHTDQIRGREHFHVKDYEQPRDYFIDIDTGRMSVREAVEMILGPNIGDFQI